MTQTPATYPGWRSLLFIPVHIDKFVAKAHTRGADAYILDLEDSVPIAEKALARSKVIEAARQVSVGGAGALVRINLDGPSAREDLAAAIDPAVHAIVLPKVESTEQVTAIASVIDALESERNMTLGHTLLIAMIESVEALPKLDEIAAAHPRVVALTLGPEDFSASASLRPSKETLFLPNQMLTFACRRAGITPLGFPGSIADYSDLDSFRETVQSARDMGFAGAFCIHPKQALILNDVLMPGEDEIAHARGLIEAYEKGVAAGKGAVEYQGKMIDMPVVLSARALIATFENISSKTKN